MPTTLRTWRLRLRTLWPGWPLHLAQLATLREQATEALRSVAHERAALDARNEFWAGWATQRGFPTSSGRQRPLWRAVKFANVDWAIKPYLSGYEAHDPGRAAAELAAERICAHGFEDDAVEYWRTNKGTCPFCIVLPFPSFLLQFISQDLQTLSQSEDAPLHSWMASGSDAA